MTEQFGTTEQITTLGEVPNRVDSTAKTYPALVGENLGHTTLKFSLPINQLLQMSQVANRHNIQNTASLEKEYEAQRSLLVNHARKLAVLLSNVSCKINLIPFQYIYLLNYVFPTLCIGVVCI